MNQKNYLNFTSRVVLSGLILLALLSISPVRADVKLPKLFGSDMVFQRDIPLQIWGWAEPGESVTCHIGSAKSTTKSDKKGEWKVSLPAMKAGGPHELQIQGRNNLILTGILVGEVWVCSGQSNMEMGVGMCKDAKAEIAAANNPNIRLFLIPKTKSGYPLEDVQATWKKCTSTTIAEGGWGGFSAAAYYFGRELQKSLDVPVGLIATSWGGTRIEPWTPPLGFASVSSLKPTLTKIETANADFNKAYGEALDRIEAAVGRARKALANGQPPPPLPQLPTHKLDSSGEPTGLYNAMISPLVPFGIRGAIWYQGESNNGEGMMYYDKMQALINGWRKVWKQGDFPFLFVQIAPYRYGNPPTNLPGIWNAQLASLNIPNTGMAVTTDITTLGDIHPPNKQDVGKRLALWALANTYGKKDIVYSGPLYKSMKVSDGRVILTFDQTGSGLAARDEKELTYFEVAGEDGQFKKAKAEIQDNKIVVSAEGVAEPKSVRFAWDQLAQPNFINKEGLPASPFSTAELAKAKNLSIDRVPSSRR